MRWCCRLRMAWGAGEVRVEVEIRAASQPNNATHQSIKRRRRRRRKSGAPEMRDEEIAQRKMACVYANADFICVETRSGWGRSIGDPSGLEIYLKPDEIDAELGQAILDALSKSRAVLAKDDPDLYDWRKIETRYQAWIEDVKQRYGYKTKRALFKDMMCCDIESNPKRDRLKIVPMIHNRLEGWGREKDDGIEDIVISSNSSAEEIGVALRLAFSRCQ